MDIILENKQKVNQKDLEEKVKEMYKSVALFPEKKYHFEMGRKLAVKLGYPLIILNQIPIKAVDSFAGVGFYFDLNEIQKGESVLDLGSGSGMDAFYAALKVGETGKVIGLDMTHEQIEKSGKLAKQASYNNITFNKGYIEDIPLKSNSMDVVISNGVINLSGEKEKVFYETSRVLKTGGRLILSDIVSSIKMPEKIICNANLWAACIAGAMQINEYKQLIVDSGMKIVNVKNNPYEFLSKNAKGTTSAYGIQSISLLAIKK